MGTVTSSATALPQATSAHAAFTFSDGTLISVYFDGTNLVYETSSDGTTWSAKATITSGGAWYDLCQDGDALYGAVGPASSFTPFKLAYSGGSVTVTVGTTVSINIGTGSTSKSLAAAWDSDHSLFHIAIAGYHGNSDAYLFAYDTSLTQKFSYTTSGGIGVDGYSCTVVYAPGGTLWLATAETVYAVTVSSTAYTPDTGTVIKQYTNGAPGMSGGIDASNNQPFFVVSDSGYSELDLLSYDGSTWSTTALVSHANSGAVACTVGNDIWVWYSLTSTDANGEVYLIKRVSGSWGSPTLVDGGDNLGHQYPSCPASQSSGALLVTWSKGTASPYTVADTTYSLGGSANALATLARGTFLSVTGLVVGSRSTFRTRTALETETRDTFKTTASLLVGARDKFYTAAGLKTTGRATYATRTALATRARAGFSIRVLLGGIAQAAFKIAGSGHALMTTARAKFVQSAALVGEAHSHFATRTQLSQTSRTTFASRANLAGSVRATFASRVATLQQSVRVAFTSRASLIQTARSTFAVNGLVITRPFWLALKSVLAKIAVQAVSVVPLLNIVVGSLPVAKPNTTITVTLSATDTANHPVSNCSAVTAAVTFPDGTTSTFTLTSGITNNADGTYTLTYTTKGVGTCQELWTFTGADGTTKAEYQNDTPVWL